MYRNVRDQEEELKNEELVVIDECEEEETTNEELMVVDECDEEASDAPFESAGNGLIHIIL